MLKLTVAFRISCSNIQTLVDLVIDLSIKN